jgi:hypothetical protein
VWIVAENGVYARMGGPSPSLQPRPTASGSLPVFYSEYLLLTPSLTPNQWLGDLPVWIVAENGVYARMGGPSAEWTTAIEPPDDAWIASIKPVFK